MEFDRITIEYRDQRSMTIEGLGPETTIGVVADVMRGHYIDNNGGDIPLRVIIELNPTVVRR